MGNAQLKEFDDGDGDDFVDELKPGTKLMHGQYEIVSFLNAGGFGITYLAKDSLDRKIVIKECFPGAFCRRSRTIVQARSRAHQTELKSIVRLFIQEARSLAKMDHPNIVGVHQVFEDNDTAYMALDFVEGRDLLDTLEDPNHGLTPAQIKSILTDILGAVGFIHDQEILHRDISPDNILIDANMRPVLIDFGAAREQATKQSRVLSALRVVKDGYSPQEFYIAGSEQNASSDLYALGASFYHLIANETPPNSQARLAAVASGEADPYVPLVNKAKGYDRQFLEAIDLSLEVLPKDRIQSAAEWIDIMNGKAVKKAVASAAVANGGTPDKPKSKMPMLMASVAVVALLGVGVLTQTDILTPPATEAPVAPVETAAVDAEPVEQSAIEQALNAQPTVVEQSPLEAALADLATTDDPIIADPIAPEPVAIEPVVEAPAAAEEPSVENPVVAEAATEEPVVETPTVSETAATEDTSLADEVVTADIPTRPTARPNDLAIAEPIVAEVIQTPTLEPLVTPDIVKDAAENPSLPAFLANVVVAPDAATPTLALPERPSEVAASETSLNVDITALVPGNEIVPEPVIAPEAVVEAEPTIVETDDSVANVEDRIATGTTATVADAFFVQSAWSVELPFTASSEVPNAIDKPAEVAPNWVQPGAIVKSVNGVNVAGIDDISRSLRETVNPGDRAQVPVTFEIETNGVVETHDWTLPIRQDYQLLNGVGFTAVPTVDGWNTTVSALPDGVETELQVGDVLIAYIPTSGEINTRTSLKDIFDSEVAAGTVQFNFAVNRDNSMWVAGLAYDANPQND